MKRKICASIGYMMPRALFIACCLFLIVVHRGYGEIRSYEKIYPAFIKAAYNNNIADMKVMISQMVDVNMRAFDGTTALHFACRNGDDRFGDEAVRLLIDAGARAFLEDEIGYEPMLYVPVTADLVRRDQYIRELVMNGGDINESSKLIEHGVSEITKSGKKERKKFTVLDVTVNNFDRSGVKMTLLNWGPLLQKNLIEQARLYAADIGFGWISEDIGAYQKSVRGNEVVKGITPLMMAICRHDEKMAMNMIERKQSINALSSDRFRQSALHLAVRHRQYVMLEGLLRNGADVGMRDYLGNTALHALARCGEIDFQRRVTPLLVKAGAKLNATNSAGETVLMQAIRLHDKSYTSYLLSEYPKEVAVRAVNKQGKTPVDYARAIGWEDVVTKIKNVR